MSLRFAEALGYAMEAHQGQVYRTADGPQPYVMHPIRVALAVSPRAQVVAVLHDVLEDTEAPPPPGLSDDERTALGLLTRAGGNAYPEYIDAMAHADTVGGSIAREVKRADLNDNLAHVQAGETERLRPRWVAALATLEAAG